MQRTDKTVFRDYIFGWISVIQKIVNERRLEIGVFSYTKKQGKEKKMGNKAFKTIQFKTEPFDEEEGIFSGYGAVFGNVDSGGDIIEHGAFTRTLAKGWERVKILALHNDAILPIGKPVELREDENGLYLRAKISDTATGRDVKTLIKDGVLNELSIGYEPVVFEYDGNQIRHLKELELFEVSVVTWAMNEQAVITDYKSMQSRADEIRDAVSINPEYLKGAGDEDVKRLCLSLRQAAEQLERMTAEKKKVTNPKKRIPMTVKKKSREIEIIRRK